MHVKYGNDVETRIEELIQEFPPTYGSNVKIASTLKREFTSLSAVKHTILADKVRRTRPKTYPSHICTIKHPLAQFIGKKHTSKIPALTVSQKYLEATNLWDNTICLSGLRREGKLLHYDGDSLMGSNVKFSEDMDLSTVTGGCLVIVVSIHDWKEGDSFPSHIVPVSLSEDDTPDEFVLVMMGATHPIRHDQGQKCWDHNKISMIKNNLNKTVKGDGKTHFGSIGNFWDLDGWKRPI